MRRKAGLLVIALIAVACAGEAGETSTTAAPVESPSTFATTVAETTTTTTTVPQSSVSLCQGRLPVFQPDVEYQADCFLVPFSLQVTEEGWQALEADTDSVTVQWKDPSNPLVKVRVALLEFRAGSDIDLALASVLERDGTTVVREPGPVDGLPGVWIDVDGDAVPPPAEACPKTGVLITNQGYFHPFTSNRESVLGYGGYGVGACHRVRVGLVAVADQTLLVLGGTEDAENHDVAVEAMARLLATVSFESR